jgi:hypothetical protein
MIGADQTTTGHRLKVALIVDSNISSKYVYELAHWGQQQSNLEISHLIIQNKSASCDEQASDGVIQSPNKPGLRNFVRNALGSLIRRMESKQILRDPVHKDHLTQHNLFDWVKGSISVEASASKSALTHDYRDHDIQEIRSLDFDILISCVPETLRGEILNSASFGVMSLELADNRINRGGSPAFWEVYKRQDSTGFAIQQLTGEIGTGNVLFRGRLPTKGYWLLNHAAVSAKSNFYLKKVLSDLAETRQLSVRRDSYPYFNPIFNSPGSGVLFIYFLRLILKSVDVQLNDRFWKKYERWGVAFSHCDWRDLVMSRAVKVQNPPNHFLADPFVVSYENANYCFVEDLDYSIGLGCISVYKLLENNSERIGEVLVEPFHMSYPYVFEYQSKHYMCPETSASGQIRLYECEAFPLKWKLKKILMANVSAADTTIFERDGIWWLFTNIDSLNVGDHCSELNIFYADDPLTDRWTPHPKNPIFVDSLKARNGGILFEGDLIYRVSQRQGFDQYGAGSGINRITHLSKTDYQEEAVFAVERNFFKKLIGTHHIHSNGKITVFDYLEKVRVDT